jgi:hypothetical protein
LLKADGFGTHTFSAGGTGQQTLQLRNTTAGTANSTSLQIGNDSSASLTQLYSLSSTFTTSGYSVANGSALFASGAGGLSIVSTDATAPIRVYTNGTEQLRIDSSGGVMIGTTITAGAHCLNVYVGNITCGYDAGTSAFTLMSSTGFEVDNAAGVAQITMFTTGLKMATWPTTATAANAVVGDTDVLRRSTSIRANKHSIESIPLDDAIVAVKALRPVFYRSRVDEDQRLWPGFIAEEVETAAPHLATYGPDAVLQSVAYDRVPAYLVAVVQDVLARLAQLEAV